MIKYRGKRYDNGEMIEGPIASIKLSGLYPRAVYPGTLEVNINGEWMKPEAVEKLKTQRNGLLEAMKYTTKEIQKACEDCGMGGQYCEGCPESLILSEGIKAIAEAEAK